MEKCEPATPEQTDMFNSFDMTSMRFHNFDQNRAESFIDQALTQCRNDGDCNQGGKFERLTKEQMVQFLKDKANHERGHIDTAHEPEKVGKVKVRGNSNSSPEAQFWDGYVRDSVGLAASPDQYVFEYDQQERDAMSYEGEVAQLIIGTPFLYFRGAAMLRNAGKLSLGSMTGAGGYEFYNSYSDSGDVKTATFDALESSLNMGSGIMKIQTGMTFCARGASACGFGTGMAGDGINDIYESFNDLSLYESVSDQTLDTKLPGTVFDSSTDILSGKISIGTGIGKYVDAGARKSAGQLSVDLFKGFHSIWGGTEKVVQSGND